jgi:hypothetical protein
MRLFLYVDLWEYLNLELCDYLYFRTTIYYNMNYTRKLLRSCFKGRLVLLTTPKNAFLEVTGNVTYP